MFKENYIKIKTHFIFRLKLMIIKIIYLKKKRKLLKVSLFTKISEISELQKQSSRVDGFIFALSKIANNNSGTKILKMIY